MDFSTRLKELELTGDEVQRLSKALKNETFVQMLHEYADEISNPENKARYERDITQLEQERGIDVKFVHPEPHHVLKSSVNGEKKCFINICSNELISKPTCEPRTENGQVGQHWSLPYSLTPGRPDRDSKGNECTVYDVVFHPDTFHIAAKDSRFLKLINSTAVQGVEDGFKVRLDKGNTKSLKNKRYKGVPSSAVIRKPISDYCSKEKVSSDEDFLAIPYPATVAEHEDDPPPQNQSISTTDRPSLPTQPHYTIKYKSVLDLQDYRCSRDSATSPRPKEIIVTVDLPLLKSAADVDLEVRERSLILKSRKPAYELNLQLSYPVNEDQGNAKFIKAKKQLIISLPVQPANEMSMVLSEGNLTANIKTGSEDEAESLLDKEVTDVPSKQFGTQDSDYSNEQNCGKTSVQENVEAPSLPDETNHSKMNDVETNSHCSTGKEPDATLPCGMVSTDTDTSYHGPAEPENGFISGTSVCYQSPKHLPEKCNLSDLKDCKAKPDNHHLELGFDEDSERSTATQNRLADETLNGLQLELSTGSHLETLPDDTGASGLLSEKNEVDDSEIIQEPPEGDIIKSQETKTDEQISTEVKPKASESSELIEEAALPVNEPDLDQGCTSSINSPDFHKEKTFENGSEVILSNNATVAAPLSFQNSLWFELD